MRLLLPVPSLPWAHTGDARAGLFSGVRPSGFACSVWAIKGLKNRMLQDTNTRLVLKLFRKLEHQWCSLRKY